jgi:bud emergence protein 1
MKALRRSIKGEKEGPRPQISIAPKSAVAIQPPKKVIKALYDYGAQSEQELSFSRGDFFHVIGRENDNDWYEACNPALPDARGLVPVAFFQSLGRTERDSGHSDGGHSIGTKNADQDSGYSESGAMTSPLRPAAGARLSNMGPMGGKANPMVYGIVMYDFKAERADELEAKAGEAIIVIAQSNPEWFVAKPIGRLGGPGLIPVSFIEIRDMVTNKPVEDPAAAIRAAGVPKVEEWKKLVAVYKDSSISLGKFESAPIEQGMERLSVQPTRRPSLSPNQEAFGQQSPGQQPKPQQSVSHRLPAPIRASISRYCFLDDKYWFVIETEYDNGRHYNLSRYYEDFYDFQIALLTEFPVEAGNSDREKKRTLPYMPGPVNYVTDAITEGRLRNLDAYVKNLLSQPPHISGCGLVRQFFAPRVGDMKAEPGVDDDARWSGGSAQSGSHGGENGHASHGLHDDTSYTMEQERHQSSARQSDASVPTMKIKLWFSGEFIAIRVSSHIEFSALWDKICERLRLQPNDNVSITYKDEASGQKLMLMDDAQLHEAVTRNEKLVLYVELV